MVAFSKTKSELYKIYSGIKSFKYFIQGVADIVLLLYFIEFNLKTCSKNLRFFRIIRTKLVQFRICYILMRKTVQFFLIDEVQKISSLKEPVEPVETQSAIRIPERRFRCGCPLTFKNCSNVASMLVFEKIKITINIH